jgi:hypothetical protein
MVELHNKNGEKIRINLKLIFEFRRSGNRTILKGTINSEVMEFEVLESFDHVSELYGSAGYRSAGFTS